MDELNLYDDLDEFHEQQEKKSKELQEAEEKYQESLKTIEELRKENKALKKNIRCIELGFQSLLDTARAEIRRKDKEIERLRKEKDDICFRRKTREKSLNKGEKPHLVHNSAVDSIPFRCNILKANETTSKETTVVPQTSSGKDKRPELHKRCRERDNEQNSENNSKRYRSAGDEKDEKYQHISYDNGKHYQQIKDDDKGGSARYRESIKETTYKNVENENRSRERDEYDKSNSRNIHDKSTKSSGSPESYFRRSSRSISRDGDKFSNKYKRFERNHSREAKSNDKFSKTPSKSPPRKNNYHKDFSRGHYKKTTTEKSLQPCDKDITREKSKYSKDNNFQKDKGNKYTNEKRNSEIGTVNIHNEYVEEYVVLKNKQEKKSDQDLINESSNDVQLEMITINSNKSSVPEENKLSTPRKLALFKEIFGNSPCEGSTAAENSITSSNSTINNIQGIQAKSSEVEVISSATTSPGDYTDLNSSLSTPVSNVLKSDSNTSNSTVVENNYEKSVKHFQSTEGEQDEIDKCFIPIQDKQRAETNDCIDLTKIVDDEIANELEFLQIPGLDLCPLRKQTSDYINANTLIENEQYNNAKCGTETTNNKVTTEISDKIFVKALKARNTEKEGVADIEVVNEKQATFDTEDSEVVDNIFHSKEHSEERNVDNQIDSNKSQPESRIQNTENQVKTKENVNNFNFVTENSNITQNENICSKRDVERAQKFEDISENLTNDIVVIETFKCRGQVSLKNPYNSYNTPPKNKQQIKNTEEEIFNVNETKKLHYSVRNDQLHTDENNSEPAVKSREDEQDENNVRKESINSITFVDDTTSLDNLIDCSTAKEISVSTSYFSEKLPIVASTLKSITNKFNDVEKSFAVEINIKDNLLDIDIPNVADTTTEHVLLAQGAPKDVQSKEENLSSFAEISSGLLEKICSSNSNTNTTDSNKSNAEETWDTIQVMKCEKLSDIAQEPSSKSPEKLSKNVNSPKLCEKDENDVITNSELPDNLNSDVEKLNARKMSVNEFKSSYDVFPKDNLQPDQTKEQNLYQLQNPKSASNELKSSFNVQRENTTHLSTENDKDKENHPFTTVEVSSFNLPEKSAFNKKHAILDIVDPEISERKSIVVESLNTSESHKDVDVNETEAKVAKTSHPEQLGHLINNKKELKSNKTPFEKSTEKTKSVLEESLNKKVVILENIQISQPIFTDDSVISHNVDTKNLTKLGHAEIEQSKEHTNSVILGSVNSSHLSEVDDIDKTVKVLVNNSDINKAELCEKETSEEAKSVNKEKSNKILKSLEIFSQTNIVQTDEDTSLTSTQAATYTATEKSSNSFELNENGATFLTIADPEMPNNNFNNELTIKEGQTHVTEVLSFKETETVDANETSYVRNTTTELIDNRNNYEKKLKSQSPVKRAVMDTKSTTDESLTSSIDEQAAEASEKEASNVRITATGLPVIRNNHEEELKECKSYVEEASVETKSIVRETVTSSKDDEFVQVSRKETNNLRNTATGLPSNWNSHEEKLKCNLSIKPKSITAEEIRTSEDDAAIFTNNQEKVKESASIAKEAPMKTILVVEESLSAPKDVYSVETSAEEARVEKASVKTKSIAEECSSSQIEVKTVEASGKEDNNLENIATRLPDNENNNEEKLKESEEASMEIEIIVKESLTSNECKVVKVSGKEANNVRITARELADNVENNKEGKSPVKKVSLETKLFLEKCLPSSNGDQAVQLDEKEANYMRNTAGLPGNVDNNQEKLKVRMVHVEEASVETKLTVEESLTSPKDTKNIEESVKDITDVRNIAAELPDKSKSCVEETSVEIKSVVEKILTSSKDDQTVKVSGKQPNNVKPTAVDCQLNAEKPSVETKSIEEESLDKTQTAVNMELSIPISTDNALSKHDFQPVQTKEQNLISSLKTIVTSFLTKTSNNSEIKTLCRLKNVEVLRSKEPNSSLFVRTEEQSNEEKSEKYPNLVKITDPEISRNLINNEEKVEDSQLTAPRITHQKEEDLKESNTHIKKPSVETKAIDAKNLNEIKTTENIKVPKQVPLDDSLNKDVLQPLQTIEKNLISKVTSPLGILDTTCRFLHLPEHKTNTLACKPTTDENKKNITDSTAKEKTNLNCCDAFIPKLISTDITNNKMKTIDSFSSPHNTKLYDELSPSITLTKDNNNEAAILVPCKSVTLKAHVDEDKETTVYNTNDETKKKTFLNEDSKGYCSETSSHDNKNRKTEKHVPQTSQKAVIEGSKNINLEQKSLGSEELKGNNCITDTNIFNIRSEKEISGSNTETSVAGASTVVNLDAIEKSSSKETIEKLTSTINKVIETDTHIAKNLHKTLTAQSLTNNANISLKSCNLETASKSIKEVDNAALKIKVLQQNEKFLIKNTKHDDEQTQPVVTKNTSDKDLNFKISNILKNSQLNIEGFTKIDSKSSHQHSTVTLGNVSEFINQEILSPSEGKRQIKNLMEVETTSNDQLVNNISTLTTTTETKDLNEKPSKLIKTQPCNKTFNPAEAIKICGDQLEVVLTPIKSLLSQTTKLNEKEIENSSSKNTLTAFENEKQTQIKKSNIKSSLKLTEQNQHNVQQKQISDFEGLIQSSVIFKNKDENQYVVINEQTDNDEPNKSITVLDKSVEVVKKLKFLESQSANMFENVNQSQYNSVQKLNQVAKYFTAPTISSKLPAPSFKDPLTFTRNKKMKASIKPKKLKEKIQKTSARSFEVTSEFSKNLNDGSESHVFKNESKLMPQVSKTENANIKTYSKCALETNKYEEIPGSFNISTATIQTTVQTQEAVGNLNVTGGLHNDVNNGTVSYPYEQILVYTPLQNQFITNKENSLEGVIMSKDIIIKSNTEQSCNENLSIVPIKAINPVESLSLVKPQYIPNEIKSSNQTLKENELNSFNLSPQITQNANSKTYQCYEMLPKPNLDIENTSATESNKSKFFKKIITKEINIEGEIVEVVKHIPCLNETQVITESTDKNKQTIEPFVNVGSSAKDEETEANRHSSNDKCLQVQTNIVSNENNSLHSLDVQYQKTQQHQEQAVAFETGVINNVAVEKEVLSTISLAIPDTYNTIPALPSISNTFPTPSNFSGIFSKKPSSTATAEDEIIKSKKKCQPISVKRKAYILPAASVLCNVDNLENATNPNKKLHWELLNNENDMTEIEDDADIDATDDEQIKIKDEPLENVSSSSKQSNLQKRLTYQSSPSETEIHTEDESLSNKVRQRTVKCQKIKAKIHKIKLNKHKLLKNVAVRPASSGTHSVDTFADNGLLMQKPFSIGMPKRPVGRPRKLDKKARNNNEELTLCHKKRGRKPKTNMENNNTQQEFPRSTSATGNNCEENTAESVVGKNPLENMNNVESSLKILSTSVEKLEICDGSCNSRDSLKQAKSCQTQIEETAKKDDSLIYQKESTPTAKNAAVEEEKNNELTSSILENKQNNYINLNSKNDEDKACVSADQSEQLTLTYKIIDNNVVSSTTDTHKNDTQDHEVSLENSEVSENCPLSRSDGEIPLLKKICKSKSVKDKVTTVISLQDNGIKVQPPKVYLSSYRIPKIKKNVEDGIDKSLNLETYVELNSEADRQHLDKHAQRKEKEKESSDVIKKILNNEKVNNSEKKSPIEAKLDTNTELSNIEKGLEEVQQPKTQILGKEDCESSASNYAVKFDDKTKAGKRTLFSPDLYDARDTRENVEKERPENSYEQSECLSIIHKANPGKLREPETKFSDCEVISYYNSAKPRNTPMYMHRKIFDSSCVEYNDDDKKIRSIKFKTNFEDRLKEQPSAIVLNNPEIKISCGDQKKALYNKKVTCTVTDTERNKTDRSCKAFDNSKDSSEHQSNNLKLNEMKDKDSLKAIKSFKMRKKSTLKIISPDLEKVSNNSCTRVSLRECGKNEENHVTGLPSNKDGNKSIGSPSLSNQNLKETDDKRKSIVSVKLRRKSVFVERNSFCNDEHAEGTTELKKLKIVLKKNPEKSILDKNIQQNVEPGSDILIVSSQQTSIVTQRKSASLLNTNIVDKDSQDIQDPKNDKNSEDSVNTKDSQQLDKVSDSIQTNRVITRRKSTNQRRNLNVSNKDDNVLNCQKAQIYSGESKQEEHKNTKTLRVNKEEIIDSKIIKLNSQNNEQNKTDVGELCKITEVLKKSLLENAKLVSSDDITKEEENKVQKGQHQNFVSRSKKDDKSILNKHDTQNQNEVKDKLGQNTADTSPNFSNSHYIKVDSNSTSALTQPDLTIHRKSTTIPSQLPKPCSSDHKNSFRQKSEKDTNEQKSCQQKLKEKIEFDSKLENNYHREIDSDSSIILTQQNAIQVRRKSTNQRRIFDSSSEDDEPLAKKPTVIPIDVPTTLSIEAKPKQRKRRVVKVLCTSIKTTPNERHTSPLRASNPSPLESPTLNHPIFNREVSIQSTEFVASLPRTPNQQDDSKFKEIDSKLHEIFQSPQYSVDYKNSQSLVASHATILSPPLSGSQSHITIDETFDFDRENNPGSLNISQVNETSESLGDLAPMLNNSEIKHLSLGSAEYRFEKVSDNVINLFISRKRKRKRNT